MIKVFASLLSVCMLAGCAASGVHNNQNVDQPRNSQLRQQLEKANVALREARLMDAEVLYNRISAEHPELPDVWLNLGNVYARQGLSEAAIRAYNEGLKYQPDEGRLWYNLAVIQTKVAIQTLEDASSILDDDNNYLPRIKVLHESLLEVSRP